MAQVEGRGEKVILIVGATGSGKSDLAVKLAFPLGGEIVSVDSMQIYKGMDIASNKITESEMEGIPHHMLSFVELNDNSFDVRTFCSMAKKSIDDIHSRGKLPILVGGTHYYAYSLLWNALVGTIDDDTSQKSKNLNNEQATNVNSNTENDVTIPTLETTSSDLVEIAYKIKSNMSKSNKTLYSKEELASMYALLQKIDPVMAQKLHDQDYRKIEKSLNIFYSTGQKQSDIILQQKLNLKPCYNAHILCLTVEKDALDKRIDNRVDKMVKRGLLKEVHETWEHLTQLGVDTNDHTYGILQAIGLKEFGPVYQKSRLEGGPFINPNLESGIVQECVQSIKTHTRQYSRQQMKWIRKLIDGDGSRVQLPITYLDATNLSEWNNTVYTPALTAVTSFISDPSPHHQQDNPTPIPKVILWKKYYCDACGGKSLNGDSEWQQHCKSTAHKKRQKNLRRANNQPSPNSNPPPPPNEDEDPPDLHSDILP